MKHAPIHTVLFDAGNTLMHLDYEFIAGVLAEYGRAATPLEIRVAEYAAKAALDRDLAPAITADAGGGHGLERWMWTDQPGARPSYFAIILQELRISDDQGLPMLTALQAHNRENALWRVVDPDTPRVLDALGARGFTLAVISNSDGRVEADLAAKGLRAQFATVVDSHLVGVEKPDPGIFRLALERLNATAGTAVYVGDLFSVDVLGARRAGLSAILVDPLGRYPGNVDCPRISRLAELLALLPERASPTVDVAQRDRQRIS